MYQSLAMPFGFPILEDLRISLVTQRWKNETDGQARDVTLAFLAQKLKRREFLPDEDHLKIVKIERDGRRILNYKGGFFEIVVRVTPHKCKPKIEVLGVEHISTKTGLVAQAGEIYSCTL